jgi:hypothetical protein
MNMPEFTIRLSEETHSALRSTAASNGGTIDELVENCLRQAGLLTARRALAWVREAREGSPLSDEEALELALTETRAVRRERLEKNHS